VVNKLLKIVWEAPNNEVIGVTPASVHIGLKGNSRPLTDSQILDLLDPEKKWPSLIAMLNNTDRIDLDTIYNSVEDKHSS